MKKKYNELEMKEKGYKKKLNDLQIALTKHMEQYVLLTPNFMIPTSLMSKIYHSTLQNSERSS